MAGIADRIRGKNTLEITFDMVEGSRVQKLITLGSEKALRVVVGRAFSLAIRKALPKIKTAVMNEYLRQDMVSNAFNAGTSLNAALGLAQATSVGSRVENYLRDNLLDASDAEGIGKGNLAPFIGSGAGRFSRTALAGFRPDFTTQDLMSQPFGSYDSTNYKGVTRNVPYLSWMVDPSRGRVYGHHVSVGRPNEPRMSRSRTGYAIMRKGGSFSILSAKGNWGGDIGSDERKFGIVESLFADGSATAEKLSKKIEQIFNRQFENVLNKVVADYNASGGDKRKEGTGTGQAVELAQAPSVDEETGITEETGRLELRRVAQQQGATAAPRSAGRDLTSVQGAIDRIRAAAGDDFAKTLTEQFTSGAIEAGFISDIAKDYG